MTYNLNVRLNQLLKIGIVYNEKFEQFEHENKNDYIPNLVIYDLQTKTEDEWSKLICELDKYKTFKKCLQTHISAKDLPAYEQQISELIDGDYCLDNYSEDGDKMESLIFQHHVDQNIEATAHLYDNEDEQKPMKDLLQLMENHNIEFINN